MPFAVLPMLLFGLVSLGLLFGGGYIVYERLEGVVFAPVVLGAGIAMLVVASLGRFIVLAFHRRGDDEPSWAHNAEVVRLGRPDGTVLNVEICGPRDSLPIILVHGWGVDNREFYYTKRSLSSRHRVIAWDLRGLGRSTRAGRDGYTLDAMADDLAAIVDLAEGPSIIVGHSIGGMITQTFARRHAERLKSDVLGLVLVGTTYTDPTRTTLGSPVMHLLETPVFTPLMFLTIVFWPLVWAMNWLSYLNGSQLVGTALSGFAGGESRGQLDFATRFFAKAHPAVLARGMLAMFKFDETSSIKDISVPVLVVPGDRDPVLLPEASAFIASAIPGAVLSEVGPARHMALMEHHSEFDSLLGAFIDTHAAVRVLA